MSTPVASNAVLVHGAYADGSSWSSVIPILQAAGMQVVAVQHPLTTLDAGVEITRRALDLAGGPTVLVGHSFAGTIISRWDCIRTSPPWSTSRRERRMRVRTTPRSPSSTRRAPPPPGWCGRMASAGCSEDAFVHDFAGDLDPDRARMLHAVQGPISDQLFSGRTTIAAWHEKPSWYAVSAQDRTIDPGLERFMAQRMGATTIELEASHVSMLSKPAEVANLILDAAGRQPR